MEKWERKPLRRSWIIPNFYDVTWLIFNTLPDETFKVAYIYLVSKKHYKCMKYRENNQIVIIKDLQMCNNIAVNNVIYLKIQKSY